MIWPFGAPEALRLGKRDARKGQGWNVLARALGVSPATLKGWNPQHGPLAAGVANLSVPIEVAERPRAAPAAAPAPAARSGRTASPRQPTAGAAAAKQARPLPQARRAPTGTRPQRPAR